MPNSTRRKSKLVVSLTVLILLLDQGTKSLVNQSLQLHQSIPIIDGFFSLTHIRNTGAAFGFLAGQQGGLGAYVLMAFSVFAIGFIVVLLQRLPGNETGLIVSLTFILAGALGNLADRLLYGEVVDFLDVYWRGYHWPAFNVADSFICIGVGMSLLILTTHKGNDPFEKKNPSRELPGDD